MAVPSGDYTGEVYWSATSPLLVEQVTLADGQLARRNVEVDAVASRVRGRFVLNGAPEAGRDFCILRELGFSFCHVAGADGTFDVMTHIGSVGSIAFREVSMPQRTTANVHASRNDFVLGA